LDPLGFLNTGSLIYDVRMPNLVVAPSASTAALGRLYFSWEEPPPEAHDTKRPTPLTRLSQSNISNLPDSHLVSVVSRHCFSQPETYPPSNGRTGNLPDYRLCCSAPLTRVSSKQPEDDSKVLCYWTSRKGSNKHSSTPAGSSLEPLLYATCPCAKHHTPLNVPGGVGSHGHEACIRIKGHKTHSIQARKSDPMSTA
jgi:hypothetical protein